MISASRLALKKLPRKFKNASTACTFNCNRNLPSGVPLTAFHYSSLPLIIAAHKNLIIIIVMKRKTTLGTLIHYPIIAVNKSLFCSFLRPDERETVTQFQRNAM